MTTEIAISSTEFQNNVGHYEAEAQHRPVVITKRGRPFAVLVSAELWDRVVRPVPSSAVEVAATGVGVPGEPVVVEPATALHQLREPAEAETCPSELIRNSTTRSRSRSICRQSSSRSP
jgi:prevent-host-death family protein